MIATALFLAEIFYRYGVRIFRDHERRPSEYPGGYHPPGRPCPLGLRPSPASPGAPNPADPAAPSPPGLATRRVGARPATRRDAARPATRGGDAQAPSSARAQAPAVAAPPLAPT